MFNSWYREPDNLRLRHLYVKLLTVAKIRSSKIEYELGLFQKVTISIQVTIHLGGIHVKQ